MAATVCCVCSDWMDAPALASDAQRQLDGIRECVRCVVRWRRAEHEGLGPALTILA